MIKIGDKFKRVFRNELISLYLIKERIEERRAAKNGKLKGREIFYKVENLCIDRKNYEGIWSSYYNTFRHLLIREEDIIKMVKNGALIKDEDIETGREVIEQERTI